MGAVYEAVLEDLNKRVALKVLSRDLAHKPEHRERFVREGRAAARIRHPNVVEIFDVGEHDGLPFLAMEFLVGQDLRARYDRGAIPASELLDVVMPVLAAVVTAHDSQVIHRDLKPENIFLNEQPGHGVQPVVLDFGISKVLDDSSVEHLTATSTMIGTPLYMSPEQVRRSREVDPRTDQYALAVLLYEGLSGESAFSGNSIYDLLLRKIEGSFVPLQKLRPELPDGLCKAIERAMAADRDLRYPNLRAFATALMPFARERTRALWAAALSETAGPSDKAGETTDETGFRADSTLRSSVRELPAVSRRPRALRGWRLPATLVVLGIAAAVAVGLSSLEPPPAEPAPAASAAARIDRAEPARPVLPELFTVQVTADPPTARFVLDGEPSGNGTLTRQLAKDGTPHTLEISADGFEPRTIAFTDAPPAEREVKLVAHAPAPPVEAPAQQAGALPAHRPRPSRGEPRQKRDATEGAPAPTAEPAETPSGAPAKRAIGSNDAPVLY
jgi:serine/threonine-protein kinase